ncbi:MAG: hypothetical protein AMXMBFR84_10840 [Candidatus Hydrogenedentota bacterium]
MDVVSRRQFLAASTAAGLATARAAAQPPSARPNILFAIADDWSWPHASAYGAPQIHTPNFDRVAANGCLFTNAFVCAPQCSPNRASILTGRYIWELEEAGSHFGYFPSKFTVFPDLLEQAGYHIGLTMKGWSPGDLKGSGRTRNPAGPEFNKQRLESTPTDGINRADYAGNFADFLAQKPEGQPFYFWYGCTEPHRKYAVGSGKAAGKDPGKVTVPPFLPDTSTVRDDLLDYYLEVEWFDAHLGKMIDLLEQKGLLQNTLVVVTGDNGMTFPGAKANVYEYGIHVPLAMAWGKRIPAGQTVESPVSFVDLAPTFLNAAGLPPDPVMTGHSFLGMAAGGPTLVRDHVLAGLERHSHARYDHLGYPMRAIRTADYLYIRNFKSDRWPAGDPPYYFDIDDGTTKRFMIANQDQFPELFQHSFGKRPEEELYEVKSDPGCLRNLTGNPEFDAVRASLRERLEAELTRTNDPRMSGGGAVFESYPYFANMHPKLGGFATRGEYNPAVLPK